jgi:hypothetical protein
MINGVRKSVVGLLGRPLLSMVSLTNAPYTLIGENAPPSAPCTTIMPISSMFTPYRRANGRASGATIATANNAPIADNSIVMKKKIHGTNASRPRTSRMHHCTMRSTVPLFCASAKR